MIVDRWGRVEKHYRRRIALVQGMMAQDGGLKVTACPFKCSKFGLGRFWVQGWKYMAQMGGRWPEGARADLQAALDYRHRFKGWPDDLTVA